MQHDRGQLAKQKVDFHLPVILVSEVSTAVIEADQGRLELPAEDATTASNPESIEVSLNIYQVRRAFVTAIEIGARAIENVGVSWRTASVSPMWPMMGTTHYAMMRRKEPKTEQINRDERMRATLRTPESREGTSVVMM